MVYKQKHTDSQAHGAKMDWNKRSIGNKVSIWSKKSTGEVQSLLDIGTNGRLLKGSAHRFRNAHKAICKER